MGARRGGETDQQNFIMHKACYFFPGEPFRPVRGVGEGTTFVPFARP